MQAVILAAGRGTRMGKLTDTLPKPMLEVGGRTLLEHKFDALPDDVDEIILIVGYLGSTIQRRFGSEWNGRRMQYVEQQTLDGTMGALSCAKGILHDRFIVMMGDDIYAKEDILDCLSRSDWVLLAQKTDHMESGGCIIIDQNGLITAIEEGKHDGKSGLINTNLFVLDTRLFDYPMIPKSPGSDEFGLPQTVLAASQESGIPFDAVEATQWIQITTPDDLKKAAQILADLA